MYFLAVACEDCRVIGVDAVANKPMEELVNILTCSDHTVSHMWFTLDDEYTLLEWLKTLQNLGQPERHLFRMARLHTMMARACDMAETFKDIKHLVPFQLGNL